MQTVLSAIAIEPDLRAQVRDAVSEDRFVDLPAESLLNLEVSDLRGGRGGVRVKVPGVDGFEAPYLRHDPLRGGVVAEMHVCRRMGDSMGPSEVRARADAYAAVLHELQARGVVERVWSESYGREAEVWYAVYVGSESLRETLDRALSIHRDVIDRVEGPGW